jgi:MinD-like ATPase involved in chromosome partitioning or flagellar assembly
LAPGRPGELGSDVHQPAVVAVSGIAGGAGRTTLSVALGQTLASLRPDPVVAVEAAAEPLGTMSSRVRLTTSASVHDLYTGPRPTSRDAVSSMLNLDHSGLLTLVGDASGAALWPRPRAVSAAVDRLLEWYRLAVLDLPASPVSRVAWPWVSTKAAAVVLVARATGPDLSLLAETIPVLTHLGLAGAGGRVIVVVNHTGRGSLNRDAQAAEQLVAARVRSVVRLPYDEQLAGTREIRLDRLSRPTRTALLRIAAACGARFQ